MKVSRSVSWIEYEDKIYADVMQIEVLIRDAADQLNFETLPAPEALRRVAEMLGRLAAGKSDVEVDFL